MYFTLESSSGLDSNEQKHGRFLDQYGTLLLNIVTNFTVNNPESAGRNLTQLWLVGQGGVSVVDFALQGLLS